MLETSEASVNSLLRRARAAFESRLPATGRDRAPLPDSKLEREHRRPLRRERRERRRRRDGRAADRRRVAHDAAPPPRLPGTRRDRRVPARGARSDAARRCGCGRRAPTPSRRSAATSRRPRPTRARAALRVDSGGRPDLRHHVVRRHQRLSAVRPAADAAIACFTGTARTARRTRAARARAAPAPTTSARRRGPRPSCSPARPASRRRARWRRARGAGPGRAG